MTSTSHSIDSQHVAPPGHRLLVEGQAAIPFSEGNEVFYNKVQEFNRDLSVHVIKTFAEIRSREKAEKALRKARKIEGTAVTTADIDTLNDVDWRQHAAENAATDGLRILDALAATALRSIRYAKEISGVKEIVVNDIDEAAVQAAQRNIEFNNVASKISVQQGDAVLAMHKSKECERFDVIDLDPYGSAAPFIDAAVQTVAEGGLLCVTCTDSAVLCGTYPETCYSRYGSMPTKGKYMHEMALRIVLHTLQSQASRYRRHIVPVLSLSIDFYVRTFVRVFTSPSEVKNACLKASYVHQSLLCPSFFMYPVGKLSSNYNASLLQGDGLCPQTKQRLKIGGPIWNAPIHDMEWVSLMLRRIKGDAGSKQLATKQRIHGMLTSVSEELPDVPLFYSLTEMCSILHCTIPKMSEFQAAIINAGYRVSQQHREPEAVKTDAPDDVVWDILRCWVQKHPISEKRKQAHTPGQLILSREPRFQADFSRPRGRVPKPPAVRYQQNPEPNWGPKTRATGKRRGPDDSDARDSKKNVIGRETS